MNNNNNNIKKHSVTVQILNGQSQCKDDQKLLGDSDLNEGSFDFHFRLQHNTRIKINIFFFVPKSIHHFHVNNFIVHFGYFFYSEIPNMRKMALLIIIKRRKYVFFFLKRKTTEQKLNVERQ